MDSQYSSSKHFKDFIGGSLTCSLSLALSCPGRALSTLGLWTCPLPPSQSTTQSNNLLQARVSNCAYKEKNIQTTQLKRIPLRAEILFYCFSYQVYSARYLEWLLSLCGFSKLGLPGSCSQQVRSPFWSTFLRNFWSTFLKNLAQKWT